MQFTQFFYGGVNNVTLLMYVNPLCRLYAHKLAVVQRLQLHVMLTLVEELV